MKSKNSLKILGRNPAADRANARPGKGSRQTATYPEDSIGASLPKRNYVKYLVERYNRHREADPRQAGERFHYSILFKDIESRFKAPTYFIPEANFGELIDFLHHRIDNTILGRANLKRGIPNYESFDEYVMRHIEVAHV